MRLTSALRSAVVASLLFATPMLAAEATPTPAPAPTPEQGHHEGKHHKRGKHGGRMFRLEHRLDRAVAEGRITQAQADLFKTEGRQLREEMKAQREAAGGQLSEDQRMKFKERMREFRTKVKGAVKPKDAQ
ncbi:hypothetical protein [Pyxidicoccus trucidator]|uniref:hypothetical protein n=1 Tax=Pyxidicoccus trucidator TaxID=2709662 RepID=UPI0013DCC3E4|nr:hypothetical protein [Pyxidicoccus trucidator]